MDLDGSGDDDVLVTAPLFVVVLLLLLPCSAVQCCFNLSTSVASCLSLLREMLDWSNSSVMLVGACDDTENPSSCCGVTGEGAGGTDEGGVCIAVPIYTGLEIYVCVVRSVAVNVRG